MTKIQSIMNLLFESGSAGFIAAALHAEVRDLIFHPGKQCQLALEWYYMVSYNMVQYGMICFGTIQNSMEQYVIVLYAMLWFGM